MDAKHTTCVTCDDCCPIAVKEHEGAIRISPLNPAMPEICSKVFLWNEYRQHGVRITRPLKNIGKRGEPQWQEISWDSALDEIAARLQDVIASYGPEAIAVSEMTLNHGFGGITRRFMNCLGTPNYLAPVLLCVGNTAQVHRATYGWYTTPDWDTTDLIVYFGQNRGPELWPGEYLRLKNALDRQARLIVIDPRITDTARLADHHLRIRLGTDAALLLAWLHVIINERLYDEAFVRDRTVGFEELSKRVESYTPAWAAEVCGITAEEIYTTARMYAAARAAIVPWGVVGDMQRNSTAVIRCQCILRALCGFLNTSEKVVGPSAGAMTNSELAAFELLPQEKRDLQLGTENYPLFTFKGGSLYGEAMKAAGINYYQDLLGCSCIAHPPTVFAAMRGEGPYAVKAFISVANNTVMSYANQQGIVDAFMNQDLVVVFENSMTPTAQLADFVLPGDMWAERDVLGPQMDVAPITSFSQKIAEPVGECKDWYFVIKGLADRMGLSAQFPWKNVYELYDYRLAPLGTNWQEAQAVPVMKCNPLAFGKFLTPSGKVELKSSVLEALGYDPLPYYVEHAEAGVDEAEYLFVIFAGLREGASYNTNLRQMETLRKRQPEPLLLINPIDAAQHDVQNGEWVRVTTTHGSVELMICLDEAQPIKTLRIPHGWWKPEAEQGLQAGLGRAMQHNDGMLFSDADWNLDTEQGVVNLRGGIRARLQKKQPA